MNRPKFTPGPWHVKNLDKPYVMQENGIALAQIWDCSVISREQADANANLIAAAPEMYELLSEILEFEPRGINLNFFDRINPKIDAVLRKARGESEVSDV